MSFEGNRRELLEKGAVAGALSLLAVATSELTGVTNFARSQIGKLAAIRSALAQEGVGSGDNLGNTIGPVNSPTTAVKGPPPLITTHGAVAPSASPDGAAVTSMSKEKKEGFVGRWEDSLGSTRVYVSIFHRDGKVFAEVSGHGMNESFEIPPGFIDKFLKRFPQFSQIPKLELEAKIASIIFTDVEDYLETLGKLKEQLGGMEVGIKRGRGTFRKIE